MSALLGSRYCDICAGMPWWEQPLVIVIGLAIAVAILTGLVRLSAWLSGVAAAEASPEVFRSGSELGPILRQDARDEREAPVSIRLEYRGFALLTEPGIGIAVAEARSAASSARQNGLDVTRPIGICSASIAFPLARASVRPSG